MITLRGQGPKLCDGVTRRDMLHVGSLATLGLSLPMLSGTPLLGAPVSGATPPDARQPRTAIENSIVRSNGKAKSCILLMLMGGPPQHSTWDPKPDAPAEVRGEIGPIDTRVPGMRFGELMPGLAKVADKLCVLRAVSTGDNAHSSSGYYMLTGRPHAPMNRENANPGAPNDWPSSAAVVRKLAGDGAMPGAVRLPMHIFNTDGSVWPGQDAGFLGRVTDPWLFRCQPASPTYHIPEFHLPAEVSVERMNGRQSLLREMNRQLDAAARGGRIGHYDALTQRAFELLSSPQARRAFQLDLEPEPVRQRYGMTQFGQSTLLGRRLVDAGVKLVQVNWFRGPEEPSDAPCWDSHARETDRLRKVLIPPMDQAFSALVEDLDRSGKLDETLVVCMAEFGRTPRFNGAAGRDHWGPVFSIALAGGGIRGGMIWGASDRIGGQPKDGMVKPEDITATIFHCLGYEPSTSFSDLQGRKLAISHGEVIHPIIS